MRRIEPSFSLRVEFGMRRRVLSSPPVLNVVTRRILLPASLGVKERDTVGKRASLGMVGEVYVPVYTTWVYARVYHRGYTDIHTEPATYSTHSSRGAGLPR